MRAALLIVAVFALYRAVLFIHELTHLAARELPAFRAAWNALVGVPMLIPSFLYEGVHTDHHRQRSYGTIADPEYVPFGQRPPLLIATYALGSLLVPVALALRFGVLAPLSWIIPPLRRLTIDRCSALVINHDYVRQAPMDGAAHGSRKSRRPPSSGVAIVLWRAGVLPGAAFICWLIVSATVSTINAVRTLAAHRYDHDEGVELSDVTQLLDTCTLAPEGGLRGVDRHGVAGALRAGRAALSRAASLDSVAAVSQSGPRASPAPVDARGRRAVHGDAASARSRRSSSISFVVRGRTRAHDARRAIPDSSASPPPNETPASSGGRRIWRTG